MPENLATVYGPEETKLHAALIDESYDGGQAARAEAVRHRTERLNEGGKFSHFVKGIWDNIAGDYYQLRDTRVAQKRIDETGDVNIFEMTPEQSRQSRAATINRYTSVYEETIHTEAGEIREVQAPDTELATEIKELIRKSVEGGLSDAGMAEERTRILNAYYETHGGEAIGEGKVTVDNLLAIRDATLGAIENGESLDRVLENMTVSMGEARSGVRTEANYTMVDKVIDKVNKTTVGSLIGPEVVATVATVAASLLRYGSRRVLSAAAMTVAPGATAGLWAGLRENKRVKDERVQHSRDMAEGKEFEPGSKRREGMETTRYETVSSIDLTDNLQSLFGEDADLDDNETFRSALDTLAATQARIRMSDQRNIDLISYPEGNVEEQRWALDIALAQAKTIAEHHLTPEMILALDLPPNLELNDLLNQQAAAFIESLDEDISEKDAAFKKLKARRVATAAATGVAMGLLGGAVVQEGVAAFSDTRQGLVEQLWHAHNKPFEGMQHQTLLNGLFHGEGGQDVVSHHAAEATSNNFILGANHADYSLSADHNLVDNGNGTLNLVDPTGHVTVENLPINPDGSMPQASLDILHGNGMSVVDTSHNIDVVSTQTHDVSVDQYVGNHQDQITHVARDGWYDNNTPAVYDRNELGLHWGGDAGSNGNGGYSMNVATMTHDGSFSGDHAVNWAEQAQSGNLQLAVSASGNTQAEVFMVNIGPDGKIDIPAGSPVAHFFSSENGHTTFNGAYAEVVQKTSIDANGVEHMRPLATLVGHNDVGSISDTVETHVAQLKPEYQITTAGYDTTEHFSSFTEMAPVIPIVPRRGMENAGRSTPEIGYGYRYDRELTPEEMQRQRKITSPRLIENPDAQLNPGQELNWFRKQATRELGAAYVSEIDHMVASSPELSNLSDKLQSILTIPVKAAGNAESKNIYNVLTRAYGQQDQDALDQTLILLHVNWFKSAEQDPALQANIDLTLSEIERAKTDYPGMKIAVIESQWTEEQKVGGVIGHVARRMNHAALFALDKAIQEGSVDSDRDVVIIRNDADPKGMSKNYLKRYLDSAKGNPETDVFTGTTQFGSERASELPGLVFAANFMQSLNVLSAVRRKSVHTGGANFGVRAAALAAIGVGLVRDGRGNIENGAGSDDVLIGRTIAQVRSGALRSGTLSGRWARLGYNRSGRRAASLGSSTAVAATKRKVGIRVSGGRIDTDSDRQEGLYLQGIPIANSWDSGAFDIGGHKERDEDIDKLRADNSAKFKDPTVLIESVRNDMERTIDIEGGDVALVRTALAFMFAGGGGDKERFYKISKGATAVSKIRFDFTPEGERYVLKHLARDRRGRYDPYGSRLSRQLYGEVKPNARRQATHTMMARV